MELSDYLQQKPFKQLTTEDVLSFLDKFRKTVDKDPLHKWIGTYNLKREILRQFFTWLNDPFTERSRRSRPKIMENIPQFKRKKISIYKPSNLWTEQDDALSRDSSYRPQMMHRLSCEAISTILLEVRIEYWYANIDNINGIPAIRANMTILVLGLRCLFELSFSFRDQTKNCK